MAYETLFVPKQSDKVLVNCFRKIATENGIDSFQVTAFGQSEIVSVLAEGEPPEALKTLLAHGVNLIDTASIAFGGISVTFKKGGYTQPTESPSPYFDEIRISYNPPLSQSELDVANRIKIGATLIKELRAYEPGRAIQGPSEEQNQLQALHQSVIERLETTATTLVENLAKHGQQLQTQFQENEAKRTEELQGHKKMLGDEHKTKVDAVSERERLLNDRIEEVDNRNNTHVRRELRRELLTEIQKRSEKFKLTEGTNKLRWPIHAACILGLLVIAAGAIFFAIQLASFSEPDSKVTIPFVVLAIKQVGLTLGFVGLGFFYLRWLNRWFDQHAKAEFELKQFQLDIDRASWLVETALEWKAGEGNAIPDTLLTSLTRNLFSGGDREQSEQLKHPADMLASALLGTASKAELKVGDSTLEFDGEKLKKRMAPESAG